MSIEGHIVLNREKETVIKIVGATGGATFWIDLGATAPFNTGATAYDAALVGSTGIGIVDSRQQLNGKPVEVNILGMSWTGHYDTVINVKRGGNNVYTLPSTAATFIDLQGQDMPSDSTHNSEDISVEFENTNNGGHGELMIRLRKEAGYDTKNEEAVYGSYNDPSKVGSL